MRRRDFLKAVPKTLCATGTAMYVAGKMLDRQPVVPDVVPPKPELCIWRRESTDQVWFELCETVVYPDGEIGTRFFGESGLFFLTKEHPGFRRVARLNSAAGCRSRVPSDWA